MRKVFLIFGFMLLVGCQSAAQFERNMLTWRGQSIDAMVQQWGYPQGSLHLQMETECMFTQALVVITYHKPQRIILRLI